MQHQTRQQQHQQRKQEQLQQQHQQQHQQQQQQQKLHGQHSKTIFVANLHQSVKVDDLYQLFALRSTNYLRNNCQTVMDHFSNVDQAFSSATVTAPVHVCEEFLKLRGIVFHGSLLVIEMSESPLEQSNTYS